MQVLHIHDNHLGKITTVSGTIIDLLTPLPSTIHITDIAYALSNICRFGGHAKPFYSVAQHSVMVASIVKPSHRPYALLHDAAEAYVGDVVKPLKNLIGPAYAEIEERIQNAIFTRYNIISPVGFVAAVAETKKADRSMLELEDLALKQRRYNQLAALVTDYGHPAYGWAWKPADAERAFLHAFEQIFGANMIS